MAYEYPARRNREMMNQGGRNGFNRRPDREDWTSDDLGYAPYGAYPLYGGLAGGGYPSDPYPSHAPDRYRPYDDRERRGDRGMLDRAGDEIASWFGDDEARRRREMDEREDEGHRGRGPKGYLRSDSRINEDVHDRLTDHPRLDASDITVAVENGEVTLTGFIGRRAEKRLAEDCADGVAGVKHVQNNLRVREQPDLQQV
jgi:osmotically-inducible protein OsmY